MSASSTRIERNPKTSVSGSRIAAMIGGRIALSAAITAATRSAAQNPLTCAPGTIHAATSSPSAEISHVRTMCTGLKRRRSSRQVGLRRGLDGGLVGHRCAPAGRLMPTACSRRGASHVNPTAVHPGERSRIAPIGCAGARARMECDARCPVGRSSCKERPKTEEAPEIVVAGYPFLDVVWTIVLVVALSCSSGWWSPSSATCSS